MIESFATKSDSAMSLRIAFMSLRSPLQFLSGKKCPLLLSLISVMTLAIVNLRAGVMENLAAFGVPVGCAERASLALNERNEGIVKREEEKRKDGGSGERLLTLIEMRPGLELVEIVLCYLCGYLPQGGYNKFFCVLCAFLVK